MRMLLVHLGVFLLLWLRGKWRRRLGHWCGRHCLSRTPWQRGLRGRFRGLELVASAAAARRGGRAPARERVVARAAAGGDAAERTGR
jgi:hypothetical protein